MNMIEARAAERADELLDLFLQHQTVMWQSGGLQNEAQAVLMAKNLAQFRATLIEELQKQPS